MIGLAEVFAFLAAFARTAAFLQAFPLTGDKALPARFRGAAAALIALALVPTRAGVGLEAIPAEIMLGLMAGFAGRIVFAGAEAGGQLLGIQLGLGFAGTFDPTVAEDELPTRRLVRCLTGIAFLSTGGLQAALGTLVLPPVTGPTLAAMALGLVERGGQVFVAGARLAAPMLVAGFVAYLTAALASRAAPALNVFSVALALLLVVGGIVLLAAGPAITADIMNIARQAAAAPLLR